MVSRIVLGTLFLVSGFSKLLLPQEEFIQILRSYQIIPAVFVDPLSVLVPAVEIFTGSCLTIGLFTRLASLAIVLQLFAFVGLMSFVIASGVEIEDCGCFSGLGIHETPGQIMIRDIILLAIAVPVLLAKKHKYALDILFERGKGVR